MILIGIGSFARWREDKLSTLVKYLRLPAIAAVVLATIVLLLLPGQFSFVAWFSLILAFWIVNSCYAQLKQRLRNKSSLAQGLRRIPRGWYGMIIAHIGVAFSVIGIALSSVYSQEQDVHMVSGDDRTLGEYRFEFAGVEPKRGPNYVADVGTVHIYKKEKQLKYSMKFKISMKLS